MTDPAKLLDRADRRANWPSLAGIIRPMWTAVGPSEPAMPGPSDLLEWGRAYLPAHFRLPPS
jgi:hypothetical protein